MSEQATETEPEVVEETAEDAPSEQESHEPQEGADDDKGEAWDPERAKRKISKVNSENKSLRERASKAEEKAKGADELQQQNTTLGSENLRLRVGYKLGLPLEIAMRLQGSTEDEMLADAEALVELVAPTKRPPSNRPSERLRGGGEPDQEPEETDLGKLGERMFRR